MYCNGYTGNFFTNKKATNELNTIVLKCSVFVEPSDKMISKSLAMFNISLFTYIIVWPEYRNDWLRSQHMFIYIIWWLSTEITGFSHYTFIYIIWWLSTEMTGFSHTHIYLHYLVAEYRNDRLQSHTHLFTLFGGLSTEMTGFSHTHIYLHYLVA